ncbi:D-Ala-D-Ala carboxypeptidase family metallohydrolase [Paraliomyxa miuraensis]|uniref:D-Ala-D-Ala carboxypeptidase family metallohydrolase n=1 Tax=Paraliomyxa miuraensis TaxID=376150 RepID=UPI0022552E6F|nr:D-Ala-D-Ala carboxypeptidase family metallohydrolase [Paraliomyxa miuraensis]MCX4245240.1 D-Ala-D-Ala carboxypeptidase family metallohydrolase [Paraliomyxa miuraensis]
MAVRDRTRREGWTLLLLGGLACGGGDDGPSAWDPVVTVGDSGSTSGTLTEGEGETGADGTESGESCEPGQTGPCLCPDGLSLGQHECEADGMGFGACECEGDDSTTADPMPPLPAQICYLGGDRAGTTCLPLQAFYADLPVGYEYPASMLPDGQDRAPLGLVDIEGADPAMMLAPNFALDELARLEVGRWAVVQPHAVESLQAMRDQVGSIGVVDGYLSPAANAAMGGALYARHQYGDGFDLTPNAATIGELSAACTAEGGSAVEFATFVHCEWSSVPVDEDFFGPAPGAAPPGSDGAEVATGEDELPGHDAWIEPDGHQLWAPAVGFVEGEPRRVWTALDATGTELATGEGRSFEPPPGTAVVEVTVGGRLRRSFTID